ncbi:MAG: DUF427 domain-containing protein [bacterium]
MKPGTAHRIRIEPCDAHVTVTYDGVVLAETDRALLLHEGKLPTRYYIPPQDVRTDLLADSDTHTRCPWKGEASYKTLVLGDQRLEDFVWFYPDPIPEARSIAGLFCFYNEKVEIEVGLK